MSTGQQVSEPYGAVFPDCVLPNVDSSALTRNDYERLAERAISPELAHENKIRRVDSITGAEMFNQKKGNNAGILIPNIPPWDDHHREFTLRLDEPELLRATDGCLKTGKKYLHTPGRGNLLYFPRGIPANALTDTNIPILLTEGEFKAMSAMGVARNGTATLRFLPVAMSGVWNWTGVVGKTTNAKGQRVDVKGTIPDFDQIAWKGRKVIIAFDADLGEKSSVRTARWKLTSTLIERGALVGNLEWPMEEGKGLDDRLAKLGPERLLADIEAVQYGDWKLRLLRNEKGKIIPCYDNASLYMENSPEWAGVLGYDEFAHAHVVLRQPPAPMTASAGGELADHNDIEATRWFERKRMMATPGMVRKVLDCFSHQNSYHPVRDYLAGLPKWDRKGRIGTWLIDYCGVDSSDSNPNEYAMAVGKMFLISAVARIMMPGCQVDHTLVLEGEQGIHKSTAIRILASDEWFTDQVKDFGSKDASMQVRGIWIAELAELEPLLNSRTDMERVKQFLTQRDDRFRLPYGARVVRTPRQCTFIGTTNADEWLKDETGNRRFWPVRCHSFDLEGLTRDRDMLWAEALARFDGGDRWWLEDPELIKQATEQQRRRFRRDPWHDDVIRFAKEEARLPDNNPKKSVTVAEVLGRLSIPIDRRDQAAANRVARILKFEGWERLYVLRLTQGDGPEREHRYFDPG